MKFFNGILMLIKMKIGKKDYFKDSAKLGQGLMIYQKLKVIFVREILKLLLCGI